jgi:hypothetical protein
MAATPSFASLAEIVKVAEVMAFVAPSRALRSIASPMFDSLDETELLTLTTFTALGSPSFDGSDRGMNRLPDFSEAFFACSS